MSNLSAMHQKQIIDFVKSILSSKEQEKPSQKQRPLSKVLITSHSKELKIKAPVIYNALKDSLSR